MQVPNFRLLSYAEADGATNMAVDEAILEAHLKNLVPPTLRFYGFTPPAISLGLNQKLPDGLLERAQAAGFEVVRRPSGGRAVLHHADFTYSFIGASENDNDRGFLSSSVSAAYKQICRGLQLGFEKLGVTLDLGHSDASYRKLHDCFGAISGSDLHYQGKKMIGSAQVRRRHGVLQHGSILLKQDQALMPQLLQLEPSPADRHANLFDVIGDVNLEQIQTSLKQGFEEAFGVQLIESEFLAYERQLVEQRRPNYFETSAAGLLAAGADGASVFVP